MGVVHACPPSSTRSDTSTTSSVRGALEIMLERGVEGSFFRARGRQVTPHLQAALHRVADGRQRLEDVDRVSPTPATGEHAPPGADVEDEAYPYFDDVRARAYRENSRRARSSSRGRPLVCGFWDRCRRSRRDQILHVQTEGAFKRARRSHADWSWRRSTSSTSGGAAAERGFAAAAEKRAGGSSPSTSPEARRAAVWLGAREAAGAGGRSRAGPQVERVDPRAGQLARHCSGRSRRSSRA